MTQIENKHRDFVYLHGIEGQVAGDLKLLHQDLLLDIVDADKFRLAPC